MARKEARKVRGIYEKVSGSGVWWVRYSDATGRIRREKAGLKQAAETLYRKRKTEVLQGKKLPEKLRHANVSFDEIARDALEYKGHESHRNDKWNMESLLGWFGGRAAADITPQEIDGNLADLSEEGRAPATVNRYRALLSLVYSVACRNGKVSVNPARLVRLRKENNARIRFLRTDKDNDEETKIREKIRLLCPEQEPEFDLALHTGMRRGEQYRLRSKT